MKKIRAAIIGYGGMGGYHADRIAERDDFELAGVWDIDPEALERAEANGYHAFSSQEELLADESIELVTIATPNDVHKPIAIACMRAGKNVISEKPVTLSVADLEDMIAVAKETGKLFTVHQNRRWDADYLTAKNIKETKHLGEVFRIESRVQGSRGIPSGWRTEKEHGGGMIFDWGVHLLDQALTMNDANPLVNVWARKTNITNAECDDGFYCELTFKDGLSYNVEVTTNNFISLPRWYVLGVNGTATVLDWDLNGKCVLIHDWDKNDSVPIQAGKGITRTMAPRTEETIHETDLKDVAVDGDWGEYYDNIFDVIRNGAEQIVKHRQMLRCLKLIEAIFESAETGKSVEFSDIYTAE